MTSLQLIVKPFLFLIIVFLANFSFASSARQEAIDKLRAENARDFSMCMDLSKMKKNDVALAAELSKSLQQTLTKGGITDEESKRIHTEIRATGVDNDNVLFIFAAPEPFVEAIFEPGVALRTEARRVLQSKVDGWAAVDLNMKGKHAVVRFADECYIYDVCDDILYGVQSWKTIFKALWADCSLK